MFRKKKLVSIFKLLIFKTKKLSFNFLIIPFYIPAIIILLAIFLFKKKYKVRIFRLSPRLGFDLPFIDNYFHYEYKRNNNLDIFYYYNIYSNTFLKKVLKKKLLFINKFLGESILNLNLLFSKMFKYNYKSLCPSPIYRNRDLDNLLDNENPFYKLSNEENLKGKKILKDMGLSDNAKFVCLNVRDSEFLKRKIMKLDLDYHSYRNGNIDDFLLCCEELTKLDYYVIRMGVFTEKKIITKNKKIIDYSNSKYRSDFMDFYLGINCEFCITTGSGFDSIPYTFRKPLLYIGIAPLGYLNASSKKFLFLPKHHYCINKKRNLSLNEIFGRNVGLALATNDYTKNGIVLKNNTPSEIWDATLDMINLIKNDFILNNYETKNQILFKKIFVNQFNKEVFEKYHSVNIKSSFCNSFLQNNKKFLS